MDIRRPNLKDTSRPRIFYGWYLVAASWVMAFLVSATAVGIFFKPILDEFHWERSTLSLVSTIALLFFAAFSPFLGRLIDRFGTRTILIVGVAAQTLSSTVNGLATGIWQLFAGRFLYELKPTHGTQVLINRWFVKKRGLALGILSSGIPLGALVLSPVSQYLIQIWGWRWTLFFWAGVTAVIVLPLSLLIRNKPEDKGLAPDGSWPLAGMADKSASPTRNNSIVIPDAGKSLGEAVKSRSFWFLTGTQYICGIGCGLMATYTVIFATDLNYSAMVGASFLSVQGGFSLLGVLLTGQLSDRLARNKVLALSHLFRSVSFITIIAAILISGGPLWLLYLAMALFGFGWFTTAPLAAGLVAQLFGYKRIGTILGITLASHMVGMAIGTLGGGVAYQVTHSYFLVFLIQGLLELAAVILAVAIRMRTIDAKVVSRLRP